MEATLFTNPNSFGSHILAGPVISPHIDDSTDSFGAPAVSHGLFHTIFTDSDTFGTPQVATPLWPTLFIDGDTFGSHIVGPPGLLPAIAADGDTFHLSTNIDFSIYQTTSSTFTSNFGIDHQLGFPGVRIEVTYTGIQLSQTGVEKFAPYLDDSVDSFGIPTIGVYLSSAIYGDGDTFGTPLITRILQPTIHTNTSTFADDHQLGFPGVRIEVTHVSWQLQETIRAIVPNLYVDPDLFGLAEVQPTQFVNPVLYVDPDNFKLHVTGNNLAVNRYINLPDTFYTPQIDRTIYATPFTDGDTFGNSQVNQTIYPTISVNDTDSFGISIVAGPLIASLYVDPDQFNTPTQVFELYSTHLVDPADTFGSINVTQIISPDIIPSVESFGADHQIGLQGVRIEVTFAGFTLQETIYSAYPTHFVDPDIFYEVVIDGPKAAPLIDDSVDTFYTPIVAGPVIAPHIDDSVDTFGAPNLVQIVSPTLLSDSDQFGLHNVVPLVQPQLYVDPDIFYLSTNIDFTLYGTLYIDPDQFDGGTLEGYLSPVLYSDPDQFGSHILAGPVIAPHIDDSVDSFGTHNLFSRIYGSLYVDPDTFGTPQLDHILYASLYVDPDVIGGDLITIDLEPTSYVDPDTFGTPQVDHILHASLYVDPDIIGGDQVNQTLSASLYVDPDILYPPTDIDFTLYGIIYVDPDQFGAGAVSTKLSATLYNDGDNFGTHLITYNLSPSLYIDPDFAGGDWIDLNLNANIFTNTNTFGDHRVAFQQYLTPSLYVDSDILYPPLVSEFFGIIFTRIVDPDFFGSHILAGPVIPSLYIDPDTFGDHEIGAGSRRNDKTTVYVQIGDGFVFRANNENAINKTTIYQKSIGKTIKVGGSNINTIRINNPGGTKIKA